LCYMYSDESSIIIKFIFKFLCGGLYSHHVLALNVAQCSLRMTQSSRSLLLCCTENRSLKKFQFFSLVMRFFFFTTLLQMQSAVLFCPTQSCAIEVLVLIKLRIVFRLDHAFLLVMFCLPQHYNLTFNFSVNDNSSDISVNSAGEHLVYNDQVQ